MQLARHLTQRDFIPEGSTLVVARDPPEPLEPLWQMSLTSDELRGGISQGATWHPIKPTFGGMGSKDLKDCGQSNSNVTMSIHIFWGKAELAQQFCQTCWNQN